MPLAPLRSLVTAAASDHLPANMTVTATSPARGSGELSGADGHRRLSADYVIGVPPSGSTFLVGNTVVNCIANDSCGQTATLAST